MEKKKIAFIVAAVAVVLFGLMLIMQRGVFTSPAPSGPVEPQVNIIPQPDAAAESLNELPELQKGDTTDVIEKDLQGINFNELDKEFDDINTDLNKL
ncbi:MAG: hypothetical protein V1652_02840 [bacterium]